MHSPKLRLTGRINGVSIGFRTGAFSSDHPAICCGIMETGRYFRAGSTYCGLGKTLSDIHATSWCDSLGWPRIDLYNSGLRARL
jgi:hypothetical protein